MREKSWKYIITFHTTTQAMAFESLCEKKDIPGRLIPVPKELTSGCGLAWCAEFTHADIIKDLIVKENVEYDRAEKILH